MAKKNKIKDKKYKGGEKIGAPNKQTHGLPEIQHPVFCFKYLKSGFDLSRCDKDEKSALIEQLHKLSQFTWNEIRVMGRHQMGSEKIKISSIKTSLPVNLTQDVDSLLCFRFSGMKPFLGHRRNMVFHIFFIDNKFDVYDHE